MEPLPRVIATQHAMLRGFTIDAIRHRVRRGWWLRLHHGVYFTRGQGPSTHDRLTGALLAAGPEGALSGAAALEQWRLRDVTTPGRPLVLIPHALAVAPRAAVHIRRTAVPFTAQSLNGLRVVEISRAVVDHCVTIRRLDTVRALTARSCAASCAVSISS